jgi:hypothetical protein
MFGPREEDVGVDEGNSSPIERFEIRCDILMLYLLVLEIQLSTIQARPLEGVYALQSND